MASSLIEDAIRKLSVPDFELRLKVEAAAALRDSLDHYTSGAGYPIFLKRVMPTFINILRQPCVFQTAQPEQINAQKLRNCVLEIFHRLPTSQTPPEPFEPYAEEVVDLLMHLVRNDNEDNAVLCIKIISDIMRHQAKVMGNKVQTFLTLIQELFEHLDKVVREQLDSTSSTGPPGPPSTPGSTQTNFLPHQQSPRPGSPVATGGPDFNVNVEGGQQSNRTLLRGTQSFKVLAECPIVVVSIFQVHRQTVPQNIKAFVPLIKSTLLCQAKAQDQAHKDAAARGTIHTGVTPNIKNRAAFGDFITAQVKTMSFLAYLLRQYSNYLTDFLPSLPEITVRLLKDCPREKSGARKELLVAIRHIINFNFRKIFVPKIDELLDERTLIGDGLTVYESMRPLAYSMLADLIHHVRESLSPEQIRKTVQVYTRNLQDNFPGTSFQTMSAKLLLNMAEFIARMPNKVDARHYLIMILNAIGDKFAAMNRQYPNAVKLSKQYAQQAEENAPETYLADTENPPQWDEVDIFNAMPIKTTNPRDRAADPVVENKFLFRNLMNGLKNTFYQLKSCNQPGAVDLTGAPAHWTDVACGFTAEEVKVIIKLFREGAYVFRYYEIEKPATESPYNSPVEYMANFYMVSSSKEEKELLETFATVFHCIDPATFHEVFQQEIPRLYDMIHEHTALLHIPQFFLASEATSPSFCGMLLRFLMERIEDVGSADVKKSAILLRLFKLAFMAVTLFASQNEQVLLPHVVDIVTKSIELALFRSIGGGKFEHLYKQILPLLEMLLDVLNNLLLAARKPAERDLYVELCLTVPARLSNLLPHLSFLMRPLVVALRANTDLVGQGLRTLELCVDNLTADYLDPIMAPVIDELMTALFDHLKPHPYSHFHAHTTVRILGKLGGRNRKFMTDALPVTFQQYVDDRSSFDIRLIGSKHERAFPAHLGIELAIRKLMEVPKPVKGPQPPPSKQYDPYYKRQALNLIIAQLKLRVGFDSLPDDLPRLVRLQVQDLIARNKDVDISAFENSDRERSIVKKNEEEDLLKRLIKALMFAQSMPDFKAEVDALLLNLARHFTIIEVGRALIDMKRAFSPFDTQSGEGPLFIDSRVLSDAILESLASENPDIRDAAERLIREMYNSAVTIFGSPTHVARLTFFNSLASTFCHGCYEEEWFTKTGGTLGIKALLTDVDLGDLWIAAKQIDFVRALMYVIKDMPQDLPEKTRRSAQLTLEILLTRLTKNIKKEDCLPAPPPAAPQPPQPPAKHSRIAQIVMMLNGELSHMNRHVRDTARRSLELIAKAAGAEVWELLEPHRKHILQPIYAKPLRALPFAIQIGFIDAVTYYMSLKRDFVPWDENLLRLLLESLALADASDESLAGKTLEFRTHDFIVNLRVSCIKILSTAMAYDEFGSGVNNPTRMRVVSVFFKCLYSDSQPTIEAANDALRQVLQHTSKLPKDLLQSGLRPVLQSLHDAKRLTVHSLDNLGRLLRLLTTYFKVEIGSRLLDHIKAIADPSFLQQVSFTFFEQHNSIKVIAAVFNIFHLLPEAAKQFKERVIDTVLELEEKLRRTHHSPFRLPLYRYLNKYPSDVWAFMLGKLEELRYGRFLSQVLRHPDSQVLRDYGAANVELIIKTCNNIIAQGKETKYNAMINTINMLDALCQFPNTLSWLDNKEHIDWLKQVGKELERKLKMNTLAPNLRLPADQASEQLMAILTKALARNPKDLEPLFGLIESITADDFRETQAFLSYIYKHIICSDSIEFWRTVVLRCLEIYAGRSASQRTKWYLLHNIVNPIVAMDVMRHWNRGEYNKGQRFLDKTVIDSINTKIWKVNLPDPQEDLLQPRIDHTRMEVLQLSAMLVKYHHPILQDARKDFIKFGWTYIRLDDVINKHAAYVVIGYFIAHYETPAKIVTQIYFSLLKTNQNEGRVLVTQALELMAPVMPKRCNTPLTDRNPVWTIAPRRILAEESQNVQQMTCIFQFLVRHPDLFYHTRDKFAMLIIQCLRKVASPPTPSNESRKLALNMMWLIWQWEERRVEGKMSEPIRAASESPNTRKRKLEESQAASPSASRQTEKTEFQIPAMGRHKMVKYLVEFIAQLSERYPLPSAKPRDPAAPALPSPHTKLCEKAMTLLYNLLQPQYWGDLDVDLFPNVTDVVLASEKSASLLTADPSDTDKYDDKFITNIINTLQVVRIILNFKSDEWILKNMGHIQKILEKCLKSENPEIQDCLHMADRKYDGGRDIKPIVKRILDAVPEDVPMEDADADAESETQTSEIIAFFSGIATESLAASNYVSGMNLLWSLGRRKPSTIDQHIPAIMKSLQTKLARDHVSHYAALAHQASGIRLQQDPNAPTEMNAYDLEVQTGLILKAIEVTAMRMEILGDNRRPFLSVLATIVEKSLHTGLCEKILQMVEGWVFRSEGTWPTLKEKTAVLHKMISFEHRQDPTMLMKFLNLVLRIYEDPKIMRTELTVRMEHAFLIGTRAQDVEMRNRFMTIFDKCLSKTASARLAYVILSQNWDTLADSYWLAQASQLLLGGVDMNPVIQLHHDDFRTLQVSQLFGAYSKDTREPGNMSDDKYEAFMANHRRFVAELGDVRVRDVLEPLGQLQHIDAKFADELWVALFPMFWAAVAKEDRPDLERGLVALLTKDYHSRQMDKRPNVVQSLMTGVVKTWPACKIPPHVLKFEAKTYDAWYTALYQLENAALRPEIDSAAVRESNLDALLDLYASLGEDDLFYGTWRRRCQFVETNAALSYEQHGMWEKAQRMYETAQIKARTGVIPFSESEYMLWEDHWVLCAQKLQQWEVLQDFAKHENFQDLLLECAWRNPEYWQNQENRDQLDTLIKGVMDAPTPRRSFLQAFMSLLKLHNKQESMQDFNRVVDEAIQLSIRKWHQLPKRLTAAHIPVLQNFQQLIELHDASVICQSLAGTNANNLDVKSGELKLLLNSWRDRLPNTWDDIVAWQDMVTWRQHIFGLINATYLQLLPQQAQATGGASFAYRGYHETAWIINRFAHVARKHNLPDVCISQLSRIYTLPNIEIQEAFLKLREQAKCHYQNPEELSSGLDVINNTNLNYFSAPQKAEFYTLKGMFLEKLGQKDEADSAFGTALYFDITAAKAWAEWGYFNDRKFKENPSDLGAAKQALTSYLQAASSYKNHKSRKLIARILWLLSIDDANGTIASGFDDFKGEIFVWWWITYIPQLLVGLSYKEAPRVQNILLKIAKTYPQALYFQLRTSREDMLTIKKNQEAKERAKRSQANGAANNKPSASPQLTKKEPGTGGDGSRPATAGGEASGQAAKPESKAEGDNSANAPAAAAQSSTPNASAQGEQTGSGQKKPPWELTEEIMSVLKTAFPLLALSMETMVDQIQKHFKCPPDEDAYRLIVALLNDGLAYVSRMPTSYAKDVKLPAATENNITRFAETILPSHIRGTFEADFVKVKPTMYEYIHNLRKWRDKFEEKLDRRPSPVPLESFAHYSPHLSEFRYQKFDDVEIPGQYLQHKDKNQDFVRIDRFLPNVDLVRTIGASHRRLKIRGHDGSVHAFAVQHPAARHCRREERILQLFRQLNQSLISKKESRRRDLQFTLPLMVPLAPHIRIVQEDTSYITLQGVYEDHCRRHGTSKDEPVLYTMEKLRGLVDTKGPKPQEHAVTARLEVLRAIQEKYVDNTVALEYFQGAFPDFAEFWLFRRRFSYQLAALTFMTYVLHIDKRYPHKINIARGSGNIWGSELISFMAANRPYFHNQEPVPFRLTPNLQTLMGPLATEGIFACSVMAIARCLTEPEPQQLEHALTLFVRDEMMYWFTSLHRSMGNLSENQLRETVQANSDMIVKKAVSLAQAPAGNLPAHQTVIDLIAKAVNPMNLALCDALWMPYL
ncbi:hypothetical protein C8A03DRAFT_11533 [Achaetomium macrosporum]|uniref:Non-specific serine/threonine protein kinase n=1 Tax=Achaetomium macrosporum TaxID=79813 RepID=A0AAN7CII3_9PEZI|nr:hypothetical protein C8A03DRAFT_11533 [Achaetomium macrosporum]